MVKRSILIIDDEEEIVGLLARLLRKQDFDVYAAASLDEGWRHLRRLHPSILFLDIDLPDGNGLQELSSIRRSFPSTRVVMISAYDTSEDRNLAKRRGAFNFLSKPFNLSQVLNLMQELNNTRLEQ